MAIAAEECESLIEHARSTGVKLGVGHNFLFAPIYERLKRDLAAGRLGRPDEVTITWNKGLGQLQSGPFNLWMLREPGNIILEVGSHSVAHMLDLVGPVRDPRGTGDKPSGFARWNTVLPPMARGGRSRSRWRDVEFFVRSGVFRAYDPRPRKPGRRHGRLRAQHLPLAPPHASWRWISTAIR